tara:strand:- start:2184 stop:2666 length:483 start_codon:yes stop_codon:yes gene_type:complete
MVNEVTGEIKEDLTKVQMEALLGNFYGLESLITGLRDERGRIEMEVMRRLSRDGATETVTEEHVGTIREGSATYDHGILMGMMEVVSQADLEAAAAFTPEHERREMVHYRAKFNVAKLKPIAKRRGTVAMDIIERARLPGSRRLVVETKGGSDPAETKGE